jgi:ERCC4-type nuclease
MACNSKDPPPLTILVDTREQQPLKFGIGVTIERATLKTGDYTTHLLRDTVAVERKASPSELAGNCTEARFARELERAAADLDEFHLLLCFSLQDLLDYPWKAPDIPQSVKKRIRITGKFVLAKLLSWQAQYPKLRIHFASNPTAARELTLAILKDATKRHPLPAPGPEAEE